MKTKLLLLKNNWLMRAVEYAFVMLFFATTNLVQAQTVKTDKTDYAPGDYVTITGTGWQSGETVACVIKHTVFTIHPDQYVNITADGSGNIQDVTYQVASWDLGETFLLTATGKTSGLHAETTFTDGNASNGAGTMTVSPQSVCFGSNGNTFTFTFTAPVNDDFIAGSQLTLLVPAGWTTPQTNSSNPGYISLSGTASSKSIFSIDGQLITINMTCTGGKTVIITYAGGGTKVTAPSMSGGYTFTTQTKQNGGTLTSISTSPIITVNASGTWLGTTSTNWNTASNWCGGVPTSSTNVVIPSGTTNSPNIGMTGGVCNNITINSGAKLVMGGAYNLTVSGNWNNNGIFTQSTSTIIFNGTTTIDGTTQTIFYNITLNGTASVTIGVAITLNNLVIGDGTTFTAAGYNLTVNGPTTIGSGTSGNLTISSTVGTKKFNGAVTINNGGALTESVAAPLTFGSDITINGTLTEYGTAVIGLAGNLTNNGTYTASPGIHTFSGANKTIGGTNGVSIANLTVSGTYTNNGTLTVGTALYGMGGTLTQDINASLYIGGTSVISTITATANGNTVNYYATAGGQTVKGISYYNLTLSNTSGIQTAGSQITVNGTLTTTAGGTLDMTAAQLLGTLTSITNEGTIQTHNVGTTPIPAGKTWGGTVVYNGADQTVAAGAYTNLIFSGSGIKTARGAITVSTGAALNGVTFNSGTTAGFSSSLGVLSMGSSSTIALGTGTHILTLANSSAASWTGTLTINNWNGTSGISGASTAGKINVGAGGLTTQLSQIQFTNFAPGAAITNSGEVVPTGVPVVSGATASSTYGVASSFSISATNSPISYSAAVLPIGMSINTTTGEVTVAATTATGTNTITISATNASGKGNDATLTYTVNKASATITLTAADLSQTYNGSGKTVGYSIRPVGVTGVTVSYSQSGEGVSSPTNAGSYDVVASLTNSNYSASNTTGTLTIGKALPVITLTVGSNPTYDGLVHAVTSATVAGAGSESLGDAAVVYKQGTTVIAAPTNAGDYDVTASFAGNDNYLPAVDKTGTLTIGKALPVITLIVGTAQPYDGLVHAVTSATVAGAGSESLGDAAVVYKQGTTVIAAPTNAGIYDVTASFSATVNYLIAVDVPGTLTIDKADLNITANSAAKHSGTSIIFHGTEYIHTDLIAPDAITTVNITSAGADASAAAGTYPIVAEVTSGLGLGNYDIHYLDGSLTVYGNELFVNDDLQTDDVYTSVVGNDNNPGTTSAPLRTITKAISVAANNDVIKVDAGTFAELVTANKPLTLQGAGSGLTFIKNVTANNENIVTVASDNVNLKDFTVEGFVTAAGIGTNGIYFNSAVSNISISNLKSTTHNNALFVDARADVSHMTLTNTDLVNSAYGFFLYDPNRPVSGSVAKMSDLFITNGSISDNFMWGFGSYIVPGSKGNSTNLTNVNITGTTFSNNALKGLYFETLNNATFDHITVTNCGSTPNTNGTSYRIANAGIDINLKGGSYSNIRILNSTISGCGIDDPNGGGILVKMRSTGGYSANPANLQDVVIENNSITNNGNGAYSAGIRIGESNNSLTGIETGPTNVNIHNNSITGNGIHAIRNATTATGNVNATCNWFGTNDPATIPAMFSGVVTYLPHLTIGINTDPGTSGFQTTEVCSACNVVLTATAIQPKCFGETGSVVLHAAGGTGTYTFGGGTTINLPAGTYNYSVTDANGCTAIAYPVTIIVPNTIAVGTSTTVNAKCFGTSTGSIILGQVSGGTKPYSYSWTKTDDETFSSTDANPTALTVGTYNYSVTDANNCTPYMGSIEIMQPAEITLSSVTPSMTSACESDNVSFTAAGLIPSVSTTFTYTATLGGAGTAIVMTLADGTYTFPETNYLAGTYNIVINTVSVGGCTKTFDMGTTFTVHPIPSAPTVLVVDNHNGTSTLTARNYTGTLLWSTNEISPSITVSTGSIYTVTQTLDGCTSPAGSGTVLQTPNTTIQTPDQVSCGVYKVDVTVQDFTNVGAISLKLNYDPNVIAYQSADINTEIKNPVYDGDNTTGQFSLSYSGIGINLPKDAVLFALHFSVLPIVTETITSLSWSRILNDCEYASPGGVPVYFSTFDDKTITVNTCSISGILKYNNADQTAMNKVELTLSPGNAKVVTDVDGKYSFMGLHDGLYTIAVTDNKKDVGYINSTDAAIANAWVTSGGTIEYVQFLAGDVAENNLYINTNDALRIQKFFVNGLAFDKAPWVYWEKGVTINNNFSTPKPANFNVTLSGASEVGYDLYGMCTGDFNVSFTPTKTKSTSSSLMLTSAGNMQVRANQKFELLLRTGTSMEVGAVSMILSIPSGLVNVQDVLVNGSPVAADWAVNGDELRIGWYSSTPVYVAENSSLLTLKLMTTETFTPGQSIDLALAFDPLNELADGNFKVINGAKLEVSHVGNLTVGITDHLDYTGLTISNYPNPFSNSTTVAYTLPVDGKVSIIVYNELEQSVMTLIDANQQAGQYTIPMNSSVLRPGIYVGKLRLSGNKVELMSIVKLNVHK